MSQDCAVLSPKARAIFEKLKPFFPPDPWGGEHWFEDGRVFDNTMYDLRKSAVRKKLLDETMHTIGYMLYVDVGVYKDQHGTLVGFENEKLSPIVQRPLELLCLLFELHHQIDTMDQMDGDPREVL